MIEIDIHKNINTIDGHRILSIKTVIEKGNAVALYGNSGVGKTTLLRIIAGLVKPESGVIKFEGSTWFSSKQRIHVKPQLRNVGFVFQDYALFPNMTVEQNVSYALKDKAQSGLVQQLLDDTELTSLKEQYPSRISGGQQQRVALARALAQEPKILLLDEPLSAVDIDTRIKLRSLILRLHKKYSMATVLVSHDIPEILTIADRVLKFQNNQLFDAGSPREAFDKELLRKQYSSVLSLLGEKAK